MLKEKVTEFLKVTGTPKVKFAKTAGIHPTTFNLWLNRGFQITPENCKRIECCLELEKRRIENYLEMSR